MNNVQQLLTTVRNRFSLQAWVRFTDPSVPPDGAADRSFSLLRVWPCSRLPMNRPGDALRGRGMMQ